MVQQGSLENTGKEGRLYEQQLLMLFFERAMCREMDFQLGREVTCAGVFDDVVLRYKAEGGEWYSRYVQAKHCMKEEKLIDSAVLLPSQPDENNHFVEKFRLDKYFKSFITLKKQHEIDPEVGKLKDVIMFTNADFDYHELSNNGIKTVQVADDFINFSTPGKKAKLLKLKVDPSNDLCSILKECSDSCELAKEIICQIEQTRDQTKQRRCLGHPESLSRKYGSALFGEVLEKVKSQITFQETFLQGSQNLSDSARIFRTKLLKMAKERHYLAEDEFLDVARETLILATKKMADAVGNEELPTDEISNGEVQQFFEFLIFAVHQPDVHQLGEFIVDTELRNSFRCADTDLIAGYLEKAISLWITKGKHKEGWIDKSEGEKFVQSVTKTLISEKASGICRPFVKSFLKITNIPENFSKEVKTFLKRIDTDRGVLMITSKESFLTCCKVHKIVTDKSATNIDAIFVDSSDLYDNEIRENILDAFKLTNCGLLVIMIRHGETFAYDTIHRFISIVNDPKKKLVLVSEERLEITKTSLDSIKDDEFSFADLSVESQNRILDKTVIFQGVPISLKKIVEGSEAKVIGTVLDPRTIVRIVRNNKPIKMEKSSRKFVNEEEYYIDRVFLHKRQVITKIYKGGVFPPIDFDKTRDQCHLESPEDISTAEGSTLGAHDDFTVEELVEVIQEKVPERELLTADQRLIIISDTAGMGKSTVLRSLSKRFKREHPAKWVKRIDLNDHTTNLAGNKKKKIDTKEEAIRFLWEVFLKSKPEEKKKEDGLEFTVYQYYVDKKEKNMVIFMDGLDEICPDYKKTVIDLIKTLLEKTNIAKIVVSTRPHMKMDLEMIFGCSSYSMQPFSVTEQVEFLIHFWQKENSKLTNRDRIKCYAESVINKVNRCIRDGGNGLTQIPLQTRMVAEICEKGTQPEEDEDDAGRYDNDYDDDEGNSTNVNPVIISLNEFYQSGDKEPMISDNLNLSVLYREFVRKKYFDIPEEKHLTDLSKPDVLARHRKSYTEFKNDYKLLALFALLPTSYDMVIEKSKENRIKELVQDFKNGKDKHGLVNEVVDGKPQFVHRTFAEYFLVELIGNHLTEEKFPEKFEEFLFLEILMKEEFQTVRHFLNAKLGQIESKTNKRIVSEGERDKLVKLMFNANNSAVRVAMEGDHMHIIKFLERWLGNRIKDIFEHENGESQEVLRIGASKGSLEGCKWVKEKATQISPQSGVLHLAAKSGSHEVVDYLLESFAEVINKEELGNVVNEPYDRSNFHTEGLCQMHSEQHQQLGCQKNEDCFTPLHFACDQGNLKTVQTLVGFGARLENADCLGKTPLLLAATRHLEVTAYLVEQGANLKAEDNNGYTVFLLALKFGNLETVKYLISKGFNINEENGDLNEPALHYASAGGKEDTVLYLINSNADINKANTEGRTPLHQASQYGNLNTVRILIRHGAKIDARTRNGETPLLLAARAGKPDVFDYILKKGGDPQDMDNSNFVSFELALKYGNVEMVKYLISKGFDIIEENEFGEHALHYACAGGKKDIVKFLLENNMDVNKMNTHGRTPLHAASGKLGTTKTVQVVIQHGANLDAKDCDEETPLMMAANAGRKDILDSLLENRGNLQDKNNEGHTAFHKALKKRNLDMVKQLIVKGFDINEENKIGEQPLHIASMKGKKHTVKFLLDKNPDVNKASTTGRTPLHQASQYGNLKTVKILLEYGAKIDVRTDMGYTPLLLAARSGSSDILDFIVQKGGNLQDKNNKNLNAFELALNHGNLETVQYLISKGFDINEENEFGEQALHYACAGGKEETVQYLINNNADIHKARPDGRTPLHIAAAFGHTNTVGILLQHGAKMDARTGMGNTALLLAAQCGHSDVLDYIVQKGGNLHDRNNNKSSPFNLALKLGSLETVKYLISKGFDINQENETGEQALHYASAGGKEETVQYLINNNADINKASNEGLTPLHQASRFGNLKTVQILMQHGAKVDARTRIGDTPILLAARSGKVDVLDYFVEKGGDLHDKNINNHACFHLALKYGNLDTVKYLISKGFDVHNGIDRFNESALHYASAGGKKDTVEFLLENNVDVHRTSSRGHTPLHCAAYSGNVETTQILIQNGAKLDVRDCDGNTPLLVASMEGKKDVLKYIVENGGDLQDRNKENQTVFHAALKYGNLETVKYLISKGFDINEENDCGEQALHFASAGGKEGTVDFLLQNGLDIDKRNSNGHTPLHQASEKGKVAIVKILLQHGANGNAVDNDGCTPLSLATPETKGEIEALLLENRKTV